MEQGLLERLDNDADRRAVQLRLSAKGRALHRKLVPLILEQEQNILSCLSKQEVRLLSQTIDKLERSLDLHDETNSCAE